MEGGRRVVEKILEEHIRYNETSAREELRVDFL
jgi:hypothetical protein